jgi:hypothetical protein
MTGRLHHVILDAADLDAEAAFQLAPDHRAPTWPDAAVPQQMFVRPPSVRRNA